MRDTLEAIQKLHNAAMAAGVGISVPAVVALLQTRLSAGEPEYGWFLVGLAEFLIGTAAGVILDPDSLDG